MIGNFLGSDSDGAKSGFAYTAAIVCFFITSFIASVIITACGLDGTDAAKYINYLSSPIAIAAALAVYFRLTRTTPREDLRIKCKPKYYLIGLLLIFGLMFSLSTVNGYVIRLFELMGYKPRQNTLPNLDGWGIVGGLFVICLLPAAFEEALFRGVILSRAERGVGTWRAVLIAGFLFSLYHGSVEQTVYQFICGCLFALLAVRSRSVMPAMVIHFINNAVIIILAALGCYDSSGNLAIPTGAFIALTALSAAALAAAVLLLAFDKTNTQERKKGEVKRIFLFASVGIVAMAIVWISGLFV